MFEAGGGWRQLVLAPSMITHVCVCVPVHACVCVCMSNYACTCMRLCIHVHIHTCLHASMNTLLTDLIVYPSIGIPLGCDSDLLADIMLPRNVHEAVRVEHLGGTV